MSRTLGPLLGDLVSTKQTDRKKALEARFSVWHLCFEVHVLCFQFHVRKGVSAKLDTDLKRRCVFDEEWVVIVRATMACANKAPAHCLEGPLSSEF